MLLNQAYGNTRLARTLVRVVGFCDAWLLFVSCYFAFVSPAGVVGMLVLLLIANGLVGGYAFEQGLLFEWRVERIWKATCSGISGMSGEARSYKNGVYGAYVKGETKTVYPKLREVHGDANGFTAYITAFGGQDPSDFNKVSDKFAFAFQTPFTRFEAAPDGRILMRCGEVQVPQAYEVEPQQVAAPAIDLAAVLQAVPIASDINGQVYTMPIEGNHWLIAGRSGSGKGSWGWSLVFALEPARAAGLVRLWGIDPKGIELALNMQFWDEYADEVEDVVALLEKAVAEMKARTMQLKGRARTFTPSPQTPLNVIIIDELAYISSMLTDKKLQARCDTAIRTMMVLGRAVGYSLVGCAQDPRKETLGFRDFFQYRVALGLEAPMVDLVLGEKSLENGAVCHQIPKGNKGAGVGFVVSDYDGKPKLLRSAWWSDEAIAGKLGVSVQQLMLAEDMRQQANAAVQQGYEQGYQVQQLDWNGRPLRQFRQGLE